jgi:hypothetical protein
MEIPIGNGFYVSDALPLSHQECTNWVPVAQEEPSLSQRSLIGTPGIELLATSGTSTTDANRGSWDLAGIPYFVNGTTLYRLDRSYPSGVETFTLTSLGTIAGSGRVSMADNGTQLMILVPGGNGYIYTVAGGLVAISDLDFTANGNPQYVVFIDGYFACSTDTKKWIVSSLNDGTTWDALDFSTAESDPDPIVAPIVHNNQIYLTGSETTEAFQNLGGSGFPFQRSNIFLDKGCFAAATLISTNQRFFMVGGGKDEAAAIWMYQGGQFTKISTIPIDDIISNYTDTTLATAFSLAWGARGQYYVAFMFTDRAFIYNITTGKWHEQKSGIADENNDLVQSRWRVNSIVSAYGYTLVGDSQDGRIGKLDTDIYQEYSNNIVRVFSIQPLANQGKSFRVPTIELTMEAGIGNDTVTDPMVSLAISRDNKIFNYERNRRIGKKGAYEQRTIWRRNGRIPRFATMRFRLSDPVKPVVIKLEADII